MAAAPRLSRFARRPTRRLSPTLRSPRAGHWRRPGGAWDVPTLDHVVAGLSVVDGDVRLEPAALEAAVARLAGGLARAGVRRGQVVAWQLPNWHEAVLLYRACWRLGAVAAPVHHGAGEADLAAALDEVGPRIVLAAATLPAATLPGVVTVRGDGGWEELMAAGAARPVTAAESAARPADLATVVFTSGSTGRPKAVLHTQRTLGYKARRMVEVHALHGGDVVLMPAPLAHISGLLNGLLVPGTAGMRAVLMERWEPERALELIEAEQVSFMVGPPTFFVSIMDAPGFATGRVESLRLVSSGGAGVTPAFVDRAAAALGCTVKRTYGSSEAPTIATTYPGDPPARARDCDGRATGEVELRVVDPATGRTRRPGTPGELQVRGPELFVGYADPLESAAACARGGWFRTGDLATVDGDGWLTIVGRVKDVIIRAGENISAAEVEAVLEAHPQVRQAVAVGEPDDRLGERVAAFVVADDGFDLEACRRWFSERGVTRFKTPERVIRVAVIPLLASGKPDRAALKARTIRVP